jgi:hypothetical protein
MTRKRKTIDNDDISLLLDDTIYLENNYFKLYKKRNTGKKIAHFILNTENKKFDFVNT